MKKAMFLMLVVFSFGCKQITFDYYDSLISENIGTHSLFYTDYSTIQSPIGISVWLINNIKYIPETESIYYSPQETFDRGGGDCDDWALFYMNIYYIVFNEKPSLVLVDSTNYRSVASGGKVNHALVLLPNGYTIDPQSGSLIESKGAGYIYSFDDIFIY